MRPRPYLRAYMAGLVVPSIVVLLAVAAFAVARYGMGIDLPIEQALIFPLAVVPSGWGVWNMVHLALRSRMRLPLGLHGALLPLILIPAGAWMARALAVFDIDLPTVLVLAPIVMAIYYLVWKHIVGFINNELGIA